MCINVGIISKAMITCSYTFLKVCKNCLILYLKVHFLKCVKNHKSKCPGPTYNTLYSKFL